MARLASPTVVEDEAKPVDPNEPQNNQPIYTGPPATPRPCPECFRQPFLKPSPAPPCPQEPLRSNPEPDYAAIAEPSTEGWIDYVSPNHPFSFKYPADWQLRVFYNDEYGWAGEDGILDGQRIQGFVSESIALYNPLWLELIGPPETAPQMGLAPRFGLGKIDIGYGPGGPFRGSQPCEPEQAGNPNQVPITIADIPATVMMRTTEPPDSEPTRYFLALEVDPHEFAHLTMGSYSWGDPSSLAVAKGLLSTIRFDE